MMAHNIFNERFIARKEPAWHKLGETFDAPIGALEAVEAIGADFEVQKQEIFTVAEKEITAWTPTGSEIISPEVRIEVPGMVALMREPLTDDNQWRYFGTVNENYGLIQNTRLGELLDPLTDQWPVETAGLLGHGETLFLVLDAGEQDVEGDAVRQYFLIADTKNGKEALKAIFTPVRVVCQNTLIAGEASAVTMRAFRHHKDIEKELGWHMDLLKGFEETQNKLMTDFRTLARAMLSDTEAWDVIESSYPMPKKPAKAALAEQINENGVDYHPEFMEDAINVTAEYERAREAVEVSRKDVYALAENTAEQAGRDLTAWDVWQGAVEFEDYYRKGRNEATVGRSSLFGTRARTKARTFKHALDASNSATPDPIFFTRS